MQRPVLFSGIQGVQRYGDGCHCAEFSGISQLWDSRQLILNLPLLNQLLYIGDAFKKLQAVGFLGNGFRQDKRCDQKNEKQTNLFHNCIIRHSFSVLKAKIKRIVEIPPMREKCDG
ncbi:hypothetical protein SDC9_167793 [bioreactor metagenome]|uniref:Uncharacterized protein n=1 Tax=bioreactor metagenome TaxID=1076179 RepID=A0A645G8J1_9ZZZZ